MCDGTEDCVDGSDEQQECDTGLSCACFESLSLKVFNCCVFVSRFREQV